MQRIILFVAIFYFGIKAVSAQKPDDILGYWYNQEKTAKIKIFSVVINDTKYYVGKVAWLKVPDLNGKPKVDLKNPDESKRNRPILNLNILNNLVWDKEDKEWDDGTVYDPVNGSTYNCYAQIKEGQLHIRGYIGISLIGRTAIWTRTEK